MSLAIKIQILGSVQEAGLKFYVNGFYIKENVCRETEQVYNR